MYKGLDQENKACTLIHGWNKLKDEDKWKAKRRQMAEQDNRDKNKKQKVHAQSTPRQQVDAQSNDSVNEIGNVKEGEKRPPDQKKAKESLKRGSGEACMEAFDKMWAKKGGF